MILFALGNGGKKKFLLLKALGHINEKKKKKKRERETIRTIIKELTFLSLKSQKRGKLWNFLKKYLNK